MKELARFNLSRLQISVASGILLAVLFGQVVKADMGNYDAKRVTVEKLSQFRPANMYKLAENHDPSVCESLLASLNEARTIEKGRPYPFMQNRYIVEPWREQTHYWDDPAQKKLTWEAAYLDLDQDGLIDGLFRKRSMYSGNEFHSIWFISGTSAQIKPGEKLDDQVVRDILNKHRWTFRQFDEWAHHDRQFIELVEFNGRAYVLLGRAYYWTLSDTRRYPKVQLLKLQSNGYEGLDRVCVFDGLIEIIRKY